MSDGRVRLAVAGAGAFGRAHLEALARIPEAVVTWVVDPEPERAGAAAGLFGIPHEASQLEEVLNRPDVDAVLLATPTPAHAGQTIAALRAGKHVAVEIPLADSWVDAQEVLRVQRETGRICMVGHTRRFNAPHRWIRHRIAAGELSLQHLVVQTYFLRRSNLNALGEPRTWTDNLLWHHAAHTVDLFAFQAGEPVSAAHAVAGPPHPRLGIPTDLSVHLGTASGRLCTLALSFNNDGPFGTTFRYICDNGTYLARYDELRTGRDDVVDVLTELGGPADGIEAQDREFLHAILENRQPVAGVAQVFDCYRVLAEVESQLADSPGCRPR